MPGVIVQMFSADLSLEAFTRADAAAYKTEIARRQADDLAMGRATRLGNLADTDIDAALHESDRYSSVFKRGSELVGGALVVPRFFESDQDDAPADFLEAAKLFMAPSMEGSGAAAVAHALRPAAHAMDRANDQENHATPLFYHVLTKNAGQIRHMDEMHMKEEKLKGAHLDLIARRLSSMQEAQQVRSFTPTTETYRWALRNLIALVRRPILTRDCRELPPVAVSICRLELLHPMLGRDLLRLLIVADSYNVVAPRELWQRAEGIQALQQRE